MGACGVVAAIAPALAAVGGLAWLGEPAVSAALLIMAVGALCGVAISLLRRPSLLACAKRVDDAEGLHDLLSTALSLAQPSGNSGNDGDVAAMVRAQADAAATRVMQRRPPLARWSASAYAGAGIAAAVTLTVAALASPRQQEVRPTAGSRAGLGSSPESGNQRADARVSRSGSEADGGGSTGRPGSPEPARHVDEAHPAAGKMRSAGDSARGSAFASDESRSLPLALAVRAATPDDGPTEGEATGGGADSAERGSDPNSPTRAGTTATAPIGTALPPSPRETSKGGSLAHQDDGVPDAYRDMVRSYFLRR